MSAPQTHEQIMAEAQLLYASGANSGRIAFKRKKEPLKPSERRGKARLTIVEQVYHQPHGEPAGPSVDHRYGRWLNSDEKPYSRTMQIRAGEWMPLDTGWITETGVKIGMLFIHNHATKWAQNPTPEEVVIAAHRVLEIGLAPPLPDTKGRTMHDEPLPPAIPEASWIIYPGETMRGVPIRPERLMLRCNPQGLNGAKITITVYPE